MSSVKEDSVPLEARILDIMQTHRLATAGETVLIAVSGGADSMALLLILSACARQLGITVVAAHYEHGIRGEASREDARFVNAFCEARGISCRVGCGNVPALAKEWKCSLEDAARKARYAFLDETADAVGASKIALAHHRGDQAETILLHLVHGAGLQGLSGMRMRKGNRIRPLLDVSRDELEVYLLAQGISWREDETNQDTAHARNLLRHEVMPVLRQLNPRVEEAMARTAKLAGQAMETLRGVAEKQLDGHIKRMPYGAFWEIPGGPVAGETVRMFAEWAGVPPLDSCQTGAIIQLARGQSANLPSGWKALRTGKRLHLVRADGHTAPVVDETLFIWSAPQGDTLGDGIRTQVFDADALDGAAFRTRRDGDIFAPLGSKGSQKLKQTLRDSGIDRPFRDLLPVLAKGERVLWIVGVKPSRDAAVGPQTRGRVQIAYQGGLPWDIK